MTYGLVLKPPVARLIVSVFTVISISDFLHAAWAITGTTMEQAGSDGTGRVDESEEAPHEH